MVVVNLHAVKHRGARTAEAAERLFTIPDCTVQAFHLVVRRMVVGPACLAARAYPLAPDSGVAFVVRLCAEYLAGDLLIRWQFVCNQHRRVLAARRLLGHAKYVVRVMLVL